MGDTNVDITQVDYTEQLNRQKQEYDELMKADSEAGKLFRDTISSAEQAKGEDEESEEEAEKK